ncbi:HSP90 family protein [Serinibacter arcticus]|uniref:Chaperone protein HtpG n=1 Tax=Serinibacter arcticus TaxID=1655435 RepID=A0A4Z1E369_9MICO|nr:HSP90 family protein [Serinibacter arcticus]TGO05202.1 Chaperone protein HtpG [Serinibacter arcticus]
MSGEAFRVDLRGVVDILSHHLYSSPRVYLRELIQNARDAVVARQDLDGHDLDGREPPRILVTADAATGTVSVSDGGIGLTEEEMRDVLATIGASSKTADLTRARRRFLGQFGIGLLSCFLVADRIEVRSRSARTPHAPTLLWIGSANGTFTVTEAETPLPGAGTRVTVTARVDDQEWVEPHRVGLLARRFAGLLDVPVDFAPGPEETLEVVTSSTPPWSGTEADAVDWSARELGFAPLAAMRVEVPVAGVVGLALIADSPGRVGHRRGDRVYSRGMLVADDNVQLAPDWAYFARLVVEAGDLPLTASREALQDGVLLADVREQVGRRIREGVERLAERDPAAFGRFLRVHSTGLLAMAAVDPEMLDLVVRHYPWETTEGPMTLVGAVRTRDRVRYVTSAADFATFAPVLAATGVLVINGSYVYGAEILERVRSGHGSTARIRLFDRGRFLEDLGRPTAGDPLVAALERIAAPVLDRLGVDLDVRSFVPDTVPVLLAGSTANAGAGGGASVLGGDAPDVDGPPPEPDPWAALLDEPVRGPARPRLVMNAASAAVRALVDLPDERVREEAVVGLHIIGLLMAGERVDERHGAMLSSTLRALIVAAGKNA